MNDERVSVRKRFRRKKNCVNRDCVGYITNVRTYSAGGEKIFMGELLIDNYFVLLSAEAKAITTNLT